MKKVYAIKNIHCADCARSLEEAINSFKEVDDAKLNFLTEKLTIEIADEIYDEVFAKIRKLIRDFSQKVEVYEIENTEEVVKEERKLVFILKGLGCANCGQKIADTVGKLQEVESATFDFVTLKLVVSTTSTSDAIVSRIKSLIKTMEPNVKVKEKGMQEESKSFNFALLFYIIGLALAVPIFLVKYNVFSLPAVVYYIVLFASVLALGYQTYLTAIKMLVHFNLNENLLLTISVFGAISIGEATEGVMVVALYTLGKMLEAKAVNKSRGSIQALLDISPEYAVVIRDGVEKKVTPDKVNVGETIIVRAGEKVALDGLVTKGTCNINTSSLTGESRPVAKKVGDNILAGVIVLDGVLEIKTTAKLEESATSKILKMIEEASENKSKTETVISRFAKYYTLIVVGLAVVVGVITGLVLHSFNDAFYRAMIFLVISCPCAFAISVPLSYFSGIGNASQKGILIKGSNYLDACAKAKVVAFDKTGTLTTGNFDITKIDIEDEIYSEDEILFLTGIGEQNSIHPLAKTIMAKLENVKLPKAENYHEVAGKGITYEYEGTEYFVGKEETKDVESTKIVLKKSNIKLATIYFEDKLKDTSKDAISGLKTLGVKTAMLSGDNAKIAEKIGGELNLDTVVGEMLPADKYNWIKNEKENLKNHDSLIYVGDGINDAPSLAIADVGISMGLSGSGASVEASDVVLVDDNPQKCVELIKLSKFTKKIVLENIIFAGTIKVACLILGAVGIAKMFMAVFADVGVTIIAVLNSLRALQYNLPTKKNKTTKHN